MSKIPENTPQKPPNPNPGFDPDSQIVRLALRRIARARSRMMVCFLTLPLYVYALVALLNNGRDITPFMFAYMGIYALFAVNMVIRRCPNCHEQFFVKHYFLNPFRRRCSHCHLDYRNR
ncbi:MAG: hypothetical protein WDZ76_02840 [Pseudohongiellaceae bacterium]